MKCIVILCDTLRRDHCGAYNPQRLPLNRLWSSQQPDWHVPTPNLDRLAARGTVFNNAWCGSTPCMPARRDIYTGRFEFLERGWGPLEDDDLDLPRQVSGRPNQSMTRMLAEGGVVSQLITDHFHLWEQGSGNYHMGYTGHQFIRGIESDAYRTDYLEAGEFFCPPPELLNKNERHYRNKHLTNHGECDYTCAQVFDAAATWLDRNHRYDDFYLHIDCFPPHEPLDPPEDILKMFWPTGYEGVGPDWLAGWGYAPIAKLGFSAQRVRFCQALYAANVVLVDRWLGRMLDKMDELSLWDDTVLIFTTDHGTYNADHGRLGKLQTHQHDAVGHIPFVVCHPTLGQGETRDQLVQLADIYPTVLDTVGKPCPPDRHGVSLLPVLQDERAHTRDFAIAGQFGMSTTITDGRWVLHQSPPDPSDAGNQPLDWHGHPLSRFMGYPLGAYVDGKRPARAKCWDTPTWLSDKHADPNELANTADAQPGQLARMRDALRDTLQQLGAPGTQAQRLGLV